MTKTKHRAILNPQLTRSKVNRRHEMTKMDYMDLTCRRLTYEGKILQSNLSVMKGWSKFTTEKK